MYTEGIQIGDNSYVLSDESGNMILLSAKGSPEEVEKYLKLENDYDEKTDEKSSLQDELFEIRQKDGISKRISRITILSAIFTELIFVLLGAASQELTIILQSLVATPLSIIMVGNIIKFLNCGTKKRRTKFKAEANAKLEKVLEELKQIDKEKRKLKEKIEYENYFPEEEIVPVTTIENTKANVKMRILRLDKNTIYENIN